MKLNLALAMDYEAFMQNERQFIKELQFCINYLPGYTGEQPLVRGMDLTDREVQHMMNMGEFYFPSFTSTSTATATEFTGTKNTTIEIDASDGERVTLDISGSPDKNLMTDFPHESEVLISCYTRFRFIEHHNPENTNPTPANPRKLRLKLLDPMEDHQDMLDIYHSAKNGKWGEVFHAINGEPHKAQVMIRYFKPTSGWTMLHQAAWWGDQAAVNNLVKLGASPDRKSKKAFDGGLSAEEVDKNRRSNIDWAKARALAQ